MKKLHLLLLAFIIGIGYSASAQRVIKDGLQFDVTLVDEKEASVKNHSAKGDVVIPSAVEINGVTCAVTSTAEYSFQRNMDITSIVLPPSVLDIGRASFNSCENLKSIDIQGDVRAIKNITFSWCYALEQIALPASVRKIEQYAFRNAGLKSIVIPSKCVSIEQFAFLECGNLEEITIQSQITSLEESVFQGCVSLKGLQLPESVTEFKKNAIKNCKSLTSINIPKALTKIDDDFFDLYENDSISTIDFSPENISFVFEDDVLYNKAKTDIIFVLRSKNGEYIIPESVTNLKSSLFANCTKLTSVKIHNAITKIPKYLFHRCLGLTQVDIPDNVVFDFLDMGVFNSCKNIVEVKLPAGMTLIPNTFFLNCHSLTTVKIPNGVTFIGESAFSQCHSLTEIEFPALVKEIQSNAFALTSLVNVKLPEGVEKLGSGVFGSCFFLKTIDLPSTLTKLGNHCFQQCWELIKITCRAATPPGDINDWTFKDINKDKCVLVIPIGSKLKYQQAEFWKDFKNIVEVNFQVSVPSLKEQRVSIQTGNGWAEVGLEKKSEVAVYSVNGTQLYNSTLDNGIHRITLPAGIQIISVNGASEKIVIK